MSQALDQADPQAAPPQAPHGPVRLQLHQLVCERGGRPLFEPLSLSVPAGTLCWVRGVNGAGKTTLLRTLAGLLPAAAGRIVWHDGAGRATPRLRAPALHYIGHLNALNGDLSVREALAFLAHLHGVAGDADGVRAALSRLGLDGLGRRLVRTLSQGQRRRVALARLALTLGAPAWLLDEPYDSLDGDAMRLLDDLLLQHARRGGSAVFASHVAPGVTADQICVLAPRSVGSPPVLAA